jgi:RimJ/RimL family protein N-acetyltransferase
MLETERLVLRLHGQHDLDACAAMWADPVVVRHIGGTPATREAAWSKILRYSGHWALMGYGYWVLEEKATRRYVGEAGFADFQRGMSIDVTPEIGWALATDHHGKGLATEAVAAIAAWGDSHFDASYTYALIDPGNAASIRVAEKNGYREHVRATYHDEPTIVFRRERRM